jgi:hypothetical protein
MHLFIPAQKLSAFERFLQASFSKLIVVKAFGDGISVDVDSHHNNKK